MDSFFFPTSRRTLTTSVRPASEAAINGVRPSSSGRPGSAPSASKHRTTSMLWPFFFLHATTRTD